MYSGHLTSIIAILCWLAWGGYWLALIKKQKQIIKHESQQRAVYSVLLVVALALALSDTSHISLFNTTVLAYSPLTATLGAMVCVLGTGLTLWSRYILADNWSADVALKKDHVLITNGPYAVIRHPIYSGLMLMFIGTAIVQGTLLAAVAVILALASCWIKLNQEEKLLLNHFGKSYAVYQSHTKRLVPYLL